MFVAVSMIADAAAQENPMQFLSRANAKTARAASLKNKWDGPVEGPRLIKGKKIVLIAQDLRDAGVLSILNNMREAGAAGAWEILFIDCRGNCSTGAGLIKQAIDMKANGIVLVGVDVATQAKGLPLAADAHVPVVGWHASAKNGATDGLFTNIGTPPKEAGQIAAMATIAESNGKAGIVVLTDNTNPYLAQRAAGITEVIKQCESCRLLSVEDMPLFDSPARVRQAIENASKKHGSKWTHVITTNDFYFDFLESPQIAALFGQNKISGVAAGDGSANAYKRIKAGAIQVGTVPEPLALHAWQLIDELNRAFNSQQPSGYHAQPHLTTSQNIAYDGGNRLTFDPSNDYKAIYKRIWGH